MSLKSIIPKIVFQSCNKSGNGIKGIYSCAACRKGEKICEVLAY